MVCLRCIRAVERVFEELNLECHHIALGTATLAHPIDPEISEQLSRKLLQEGFELLSDKKSETVNEIKSLIIGSVQNKEPLKVNLSTYLAQHLNQDYSSLSKLFSAVEGITIEKFALAQRIERVKELITYDELNLSEIAYRLNYSSVAHLSTQFKKTTGMTPSEFKKMQGYHRTALDKL